ncbi:MAG: PilZ domain-containing protein [Deltaproteobacteria bacterium]|nr:PilZ domain-containing protein [Deltaproteobacteria bacterium]
MSQDDDTRAYGSGRRPGVATRYPTVNFVWYSILDDESDGEELPSEGISKTCDISASGVGILVPRPLPVGKRIFLEVATKEFNLSAVGRVVYSKASMEGYYRVGVQFMVIPPNDRLRLARHFRSNGNP